IGEVVDGIERRRLVGRSEARMRRRDQPRVGRKPVKHRRGGGGPPAGVQGEEGGGGSPFDRIGASAIELQRKQRSASQPSPPRLNGRFPSHPFAILCEIPCANEIPPRRCSRWAGIPS